MNNHSPWLDFERKEFPELNEDRNCDVVIVGGGISGVSTLYYLLKNTAKKVVLLEKDRIASGATGHNAGFAINWFEKLTQELIDDFGLEKTKNGYHELDRSWELLTGMIGDTDGERPHFIKGGGEVFTSVEHFLSSLKEEPANEKIGRAGWKYILSKDRYSEKDIPGEAKKYLKAVDQHMILERFRIRDKRYIAAAFDTGNITKKARINSAKLCYDLIDFLSDIYADRFKIFENSKVKSISTSDFGNETKTYNGTIRSEAVVLCTNGYADFSINNGAVKKHKSLEKIIGYMVGYKDDGPEDMTAALFDDEGAIKNVPYFYFHKVKNENRKETITVIGGPERTLLLDEEYDPNEEYKEEIVDIYKKFLEDTFEISRQTFDYKWHGVMAYTEKGNRWVGRDNDFPNLIYNLGCNGIGLLAAIMGGEKVARIINGEKIPPSMFDPY